MVHGPVATNVTGLLDPPPLALTLKSGELVVLLGIGAKVIVWFALEITNCPFADGTPVPVEARITNGYVPARILVLAVLVRVSVIVREF
jgi:hypothetical protein